jgi:hypothetical protein
MDELLLDYALDQLPAADRAVVGNLIDSDAEVAARYRAIATALAPLASDRDADADADAPPPGLALSAVAFTAEYLVANGLYSARDGFTPDSPAAIPDSAYRESRLQPLLRPWVNVAVVSAIVLLTIGLGLTLVQKSRVAAQQLACQENLRELHAGLAGYSDTHDGRFPQAGTASVPTAGEFYSELARAGQPLPESARLCPLQPTDRLASSVGYAYSLGFRDPLGRLYGLRKPETAEDLTPILADLPGSRHAGWNVLHVGGAVQFLRSHISVTGDDLFTNDAGRPAAGLHRGDVCLGRPFDVP